jgi:3-dehydroquinate synthase
MREVELLSSRILVGAGLLSQDPGRLAETLGRPRRAFVLTDRPCRPYARRVREALLRAGARVGGAVLPPGEPQKKLSTAATLYERLARFGMDRRSTLVAVGGGVITDLGGFVASTYMRGIPLVLVPTTLLGQVDAAIGGKTGVNLPQGKNLVGTFYQPRAVLCDPATLATLPPREYVSGLGEVVKYGMIRDAELFAALERQIEGLRARSPEVLEEVVFRCASIKAAVVREDEKESGLRAILNYGHTIGHALEAAGDYRALSHGEAVAVGMEAEAVIALKMGLAPLEVLAAQNRLLKLCGLPTRVRRLPRRRILSALRLDKKGVEGHARFVLPQAVGRVRWGVEAPDEFIDAALRTVTLDR